MKNLFRVLALVITFFSAISSLNAQWIQTNGLSDGHIYCIAVLGKNLVVGDGPTTVDHYYIGGGTFLSSDNGNSWDTIRISPSGNVANVLAIKDTVLFAHADGGVFRSTDNGSSWTSIDSGLTNYDLTTFAFSGTNIFAGIYGQGVFLSTNNGDSWTAANTGMEDAYVECLAIRDTELFAGTDKGVFLSINNGTSWTAVSNGLIESVHWIGLGTTVVQALTFIGGTLFAGTDGGGVFFTTNNGTNWFNSSSGLTFAGGNVMSLVTSGDRLFAGTWGGVFLSTDHDTTWSAVNTGSLDSAVYSLAIKDSFLFAGTWGHGVWKRTLSEMTTSVKQADNRVPKRFALLQNFPNPFNPSTIIGYQLTTNVFVSLMVFDVLGRRVETLVNERQSAGNHSITFNAGSLPSGIYFYRLDAGTYHDTKKLLLLK